jgi:hypothetical protein
MLTCQPASVKNPPYFILPSRRQRHSITAAHHVKDQSSNFVAEFVVIRSHRLRAGSTLSLTVVDGENLVGELVSVGGDRVVWIGLKQRSGFRVSRDGHS